MRAKRYIKETTSGINAEFYLQKITNSVVFNFIKRNRKFIAPTIFVAIIIPAFIVCSVLSLRGTSQGSEDALQMLSSPATAVSTKKGVIEIPKGVVNANPFLPYRNIDEDSSKLDVPEYSLVEPPEFADTNSDAARVMDTIVSGILYDKYSPSAILNIEGTDYLVKKGDIVNNYKVLSILKDSVTVKLGQNIYKAGIGEILTEGTVNKNDVSNLSKKFGGAR